MGSFKEISARYTLAWLGFLGVLTVYFCRLNLSIGIVAMVRQKRATLSGSNISICPSTTSQNWSNLGSSTDEDHSGEFDWDPGAQGDLLASYYYGYIFTQAIGPILATRVGYKRVWGFAMILSGRRPFLAIYSHFLHQKLAKKGLVCIKNVYLVENYPQTTSLVV